MNPLATVIDIFRRERAHQNLTPGERSFLRAFYGVLFSLISAGAYTLVEWANQKLELRQLWPALIIALGGVLLATFKTYASSLKDPPLVTSEPAPTTVQGLEDQAKQALTDPSTVQRVVGDLTTSTSGSGPSAIGGKS